MFGMSASENIEDNSPYAFLFSMSISCLQFVFRAFHILFFIVAVEYDGTEEA